MEISIRRRILLMVSVTFLSIVIEAQEKPPRYEAAPCTFEAEVAADEVQCGYLVVPENRQIENSRTLRLAVAVVKSTSASPRPDPMVFLSGGPGGASVEFVPGRLDSPFWNRYRQDRDLIFYDQRGTGFSDPKFCPALDVALYTAAFRGMPVEEQREFELDAVRSCRAEMLAAGIDFASYNSKTSAFDLDDLRRALGYESWNLFGVSYGTRLALSAMRETPKGIRSVVIDSTSPPNVPPEDDNEKLMRSLQLVFDRCAADSNCRSSFPALEQDFFSMLSDLEVDPIEIAMGDTDRFPGGRIVIDGTVIAAGIFQGLYDQAFPPFFPLLIQKVSERNEDVLFALADSLVRDPGYMSQGLYYAVDCYEHIAFATPEMIAADRARHPRLAVFHEFKDDLLICDAWHHERADSSEAEPVYSEIPTLIAAGEFDPITPPDYGRIAAKGLPNSTFFEVPGAGHGATPYNDCTRGIMQAFLEDPAMSPDTSCVDDVLRADFITDVFVNPGIYQLVRQFQYPPPAVILLGLGLVFLLIISAIVVWPVSWLIRRVFRNRSVASRNGRAARGLAWITAVIVIGFMAGLALAIQSASSENYFLPAIGVMPSARNLFFVPWLIAILTIGMAMFCVLAWKQRWWNAAHRVHYSLVAVACAGFLVWVGNLGLMSS